jgi:metallo-beta-lactamase class B
MAGTLPPVQTHDVCTHPWRFAVEPFRVIDRIYYVGNTDVSSHLIETGEGLILLDTAFPQTVYLLLESVRKLGFDPADIKYILHSHAHYDHMGGTKAIAELVGARTFLGEQDIPLLAERPELTWAEEYGVAFHEVFEVDQPLHDGDVVRLGAVAARCAHIPGHTPGAMSWFLDATEGGRTYRVGFHGGPGLNTLSDEFLSRRGLPQSCRDNYMQSLEKMKREPVDVFLGIHPSQSDTLGRQARRTPEVNPFIDPQAWPAFLDGLQDAAAQLFGENPRRDHP